MRAGASFILGFFCLCLEVFSRELMAPSLYAPTFFLIFVLWLGTHQTHLFLACSLGFLCIISDGFASSTVGTHMIPYGVVHLLSLALSEKFTLNRALGAAALAAGGVIIHLVIMATVTHFLFPDSGMNARIGALIVPRLATGCVLAPLLFPLFDRVTGVGSRSEANMTLGSRRP